MDQAKVTDPSAPMGANAFFARCAADVGRDAWAHGVDACQRAALFLGVRQQRSERLVRQQYLKLALDERRAVALEASSDQPHRHNMGA